MPRVRRAAARRRCIAVRCFDTQDYTLARTRPGFAAFAARPRVRRFGIEEDMDKISNMQAIGHYERLRAELAEAYAEVEWNSAKIDRIADALAALERTLAAAAPLEEQEAVAAWITSVRRGVPANDDSTKRQATR